MYQCIDVLPVKDRVAFKDVDFPVSAGPIHTTTGHPELTYNYGGSYLLKAHIDTGSGMYLDDFSVM